AVRCLVAARTSPAAAVEWSLFVASLGGALGSLDYRHTRSIPAITRPGIFCWLLSTVWGSLFLLAASVSSDTSAPIRLPQLGGAIGLSALMSVIALMPLNWLRAAWRSRPAP